MPVLTLSQFIDNLRINSYSFDLTENLVTPGKTGSGTVLVASSGNRLWQGTVSCSSWTHDGQRELDSLIHQIQTAGHFFEFSPKLAQYPAKDSKGLLLGAASVRITNPAAGYNVSFTGLPNAYKLTAGDYFSYLHAATGTHRLHEIAESKTAATNGTLTIRMVNPFLANALPVNNTNATFIKPKVTCRYMPNTNKFGMVNLDHKAGASFSFIQANAI